MVGSFSAKAVNDLSFLATTEHQFWFDINDVPTVRLSFSEQNWQLLLQSTKNSRNEVSADFIFYKDGAQYSLSNIGVKVSGNTSFVLPMDSNGLFVQANFTLDFDEFIDNQELSGISALKLKRFNGDPSYVREPLSNQIMHNFGVFTAHSSTYARVEVLVENKPLGYFGVYRLNESVNRHEYLDKRFGVENDAGFLWQGNYKGWGTAHFSRINSSWGGVGDFDDASFEYKGKGSKYDIGHEQLVRMATAFTELEGEAFEQYADQHINISLLLKGLAIESVLGHWDGFWGNGNNYFVYIDESEVMHFVPYDMDNTLGTSNIVNDSGKQDPIHFTDSAREPLLVKKILSRSKYLDQYKTYLSTLVTADNLMVESYAVPWIENVHRQIKPFVSNDTGDNNYVEDHPAYWGNQSSYRLFNLDTGNNWYQTRKDAVNKAVNNQFASMYYRGVSNGWGSTAMTSESASKWSVIIDTRNGEQSNYSFKFDVYGDWQVNFGDDNQDGVLEASGANILLPNEKARYLIELNTDSNEYQITKIMIENLKPTADAGIDQEITVGQEVWFDGTKSVDTDGQIVQYQWSNGLQGSLVNLIYPEVGVYLIELVVTDNSGEQHSDIVQITVKPVTPIPGTSLEIEPNLAKDSAGSLWGTLLLIIISFYFRNVLFIHKLRIKI